MNPYITLHLATLVGLVGIALLAGWVGRDMLEWWLEVRATRRPRALRVPDPDEVDEEWRQAVQERNRVLAEQSGMRDRAMDGRPLIDKPAPRGGRRAAR